MEANGRAARRQLHSHSHHSMLLTQTHHAAAHVPAAPLPLPPGLLKRSISGAFSSAVAAAAGDAASMTLGDILQRDAVMRQSAHIRASMEVTGHRIDTLERELAGLRCRLRRSEQAAAAAAAAHTASAAIDRVSAKSASFRIPRSRLWDGEEISSGRPAPAPRSRLSKDSVGAKLGIKSRLVHGFKNLFGRRPGNGLAPPASSELGTWGWNLDG